MYNQNSTHKILGDFEIQTVYLIQVRTPNVVLIKKEKSNCPLVDFDVLVEHKLKLEKA